MAVELDVAFGVFDDFELGRDVVLFVGDAVRVEAFYNVLDAFRECNCLFFNNFEVFDFDDGSGRGYQTDFIQILEVEIFVGNLDEPFLSVFFAVDVGAEIHRGADLFETQNLNDLEHFVGRDMINNGAIFDG